MDKYQISLRVTADEKKMLMKRAARYGMTMNGLFRFWIHSESSAPRAFTKIRCNACDGTGKLEGGYPCQKCRTAGFMYAEI